MSLFCKLDDFLFKSYFGVPVTFFLSLHDAQKNREMEKKYVAEVRTTCRVKPDTMFLVIRSTSTFHWSALSPSVSSFYLDDVLPHSVFWNFLFLSLSFSVFTTNTGAPARTWPFVEYTGNTKQQGFVQLCCQVTPRVSSLSLKLPFLVRITSPGRMCRYPLLES